MAYKLQNLSNIHHRMSSEQLQEVFHVDHVDLVPHYELVTLTHHTNRPVLASSRRKRSIDSSQSVAKSNGLGNGGNHHVKKDLSKVRFTEKVSELTVKPAGQQQRKPVPKDVDRPGGQQVPLEAGPLVSSEPRMQQPVDDSVPLEPMDGGVSIADISEHRVEFDAFGEKVNLTLHKTEGLLRGGAHSLRMWNVRSDPNSTQGLVYEEIHDEVHALADA
uniref:Uncharacterized protein n=1 Tax=Anopheles epiroticus TaxID=199890 RepID=A0A182P6X2_9DIPT